MNIKKISKYVMFSVGAVVLMLVLGLLAMEGWYKYKEIKARADVKPFFNKIIVGMNSGDLDDLTKGTSIMKWEEGDQGAPPPKPTALQINDENYSVYIPQIDYGNSYGVSSPVKDADFVGIVTKKDNKIREVYYVASDNKLIDKKVPTQAQLQKEKAEEESKLVNDKNAEITYKVGGAIYELTALELVEGVTIFVNPPLDNSHIRDFLKFTYKKYYKTDLSGDSDAITHRGTKKDVDYLEVKYTNGKKIYVTPFGDEKSIARVVLYTNKPNY